MKQSALRKEYWRVQHLPVLNSVWKFHLRAISLFKQNFSVSSFVVYCRSWQKCLFAKPFSVIYHQSWSTEKVPGDWRWDNVTHLQEGESRELSDWFWYYGRSCRRSSWVPSNSVCARARGLGLASEGSWKAHPAWSPWSGWSAYWMRERLGV